MDKAIESLEEIVHKLKWSLAQSDEYHEIEKSKLREVIETLRAENARYREALEFYANLSNWRFTDRFDYPYYETLEGDVSYHDGKFFAGHKAREALGKV